MSVHLHSPQGLVTKVLGFEYIPSPHTGLNIKRKYDDMLSAYGLNCSDTFKTVSDNRYVTILQIIGRHLVHKICVQVFNALRVCMI